MVLQSWIIVRKNSLGIIIIIIMIIRDFETQTDQLISDRRPDLVIINKKKKKEHVPNSRLCRSV